MPLEAKSPAHRDPNIGYDNSIMLHALCAKWDIIPSTLPGFRDPPNPRRSHSPSIQSVSSSSVGVAMSSLGISDAQSVVSAEISGTSLVLALDHFGDPDLLQIKPKDADRQVKARVGHVVHQRVVPRVHIFRLNLYNHIYTPLSI